MYLFGLNMKINKVYKYILMMSLLLLNACSTDDGSLTSPSSYIGPDGITEEQEFDAYLKYKRLTINNPQRYQSSFKIYLEDKALAKAVAQNTDFDTALIDAEVEDLRRSLLVNQYIVRELKERITDVALREYFEKNRRQFVGSEFNLIQFVFPARNTDSTKYVEKSEAEAIRIQNKLFKGGGVGGVISEMDAKKLSTVDIYPGLYKKDKWVSEKYIKRTHLPLINKIKVKGVTSVFQDESGFVFFYLLEPKRTIEPVFEDVAESIRRTLYRSEKINIKNELLNKI